MSVIHTQHLFCVEKEDLMRKIKAVRPEAASVLESKCPFFFSMCCSDVYNMLWYCSTLS